jgi:transitional endoplasmic reticulum ATPase
MTVHEFESQVRGTVAKVTDVDSTTGNVYFRLVDGRTGRAFSGDEPLPAHGDVILVGDTFWEPAPEQLWTEKNTIAIVSVVREGTVYVDDGLTLKPIPFDGSMELTRNNTIEYNDVDGVVSVVSETPLRSRDHGLGDVDVMKDYLIGAGDSGPTFNDFGGYPHVIERAKELIETQLERRGLLDRIGARPVKGILFTGPPGTGKTHLARIIANESKADFFLVSGPSIVSKWVGDTEDTLRKIFDAAAKSESGRAIIFFDEIDSIAERRTSDSHEASKRLVAQLLTLLDGFDSAKSSVVVIAATNRIDDVDPALTRPGRFDWEIEFGLPTVNDRFEILKVRSSQLRTSDDLPLEELAQFSDGWSAAELTSVWTEAALIAAGDQRSRITGEDLAQGFERVATRPRRKTGAEK